MNLKLSIASSRIMIWAAALLIIIVLGGGLFALFWKTRILETFSVQPRWDGGTIRVAIPGSPYRRVETGEPITIRSDDRSEFEGRVERVDLSDGSIFLWIDPGPAAPDFKKICADGREARITLRSKRLIATFFRR